MNEEIFKLENVNFSYDKIQVINDFSTAIKSNLITGVLGPNGSGKSTLLKLLSGYLKCSSGKIRIKNKDLSVMSLKEISRSIALVSQNNLPLNINVFDFILMGRIPFFKDGQLFETEKDIIKATEFMKITDTYKFKDKSLSRLSGGERQLVNITKALVQQPEILLLDEPTSYLDISHQIKIMDLIKNFKNEFKLSVIIVLHDLNLAGLYCNEIIMMNEGKVETAGTADSVLKYEIIEKVYKTVVIVEKSPINGKPHVFLVSNDSLKKNLI